ncbi:hypothetical protein EYF80_043111 [Liparis tanakae]|uniref:Uncharacterized protein n=1 Tax=Liparis tanakae TaxID=230148 RepID=A0A4Z2G1B5_9TELE|nr:hypothetical protein EYF80_043111 [Liparis tanakae]
MDETVKPPRLTAIVNNSSRPGRPQYLPKRVDLRRRHQAMLARMKKAPQRPPNTPSRMKGMSSNRSEPYLLQAEEHASNRGAESNGDPGRRRSRENLRGTKQMHLS